MKTSPLSRSTKPLKRSPLRTKTDAAKLTPLGKQLSVKPRNLKCAICKKPFLTFSSFVKWCSPDCGAELALRKLEKKAKAVKQAERADDRQRKEEIKRRSDWIKEAQQVFNAFRREWCRANGYDTCPDCGQPLDWSGNNVDAGHYRSVGSAPHMRFTENNVWAQRKQCNRYGAGRAVDYRIGLIARIGLDAVEALEADTESRKWTIDELKAIKATYKAKLKALQATRASHHPE